MIYLFCVATYAYSRLHFTFFIATSVTRFFVTQPNKSSIFQQLRSKAFSYVTDCFIHFISKSLLKLTIMMKNGQYNPCQ